MGFNVMGLELNLWKEAALWGGPGISASGLVVHSEQVT